MKKNANEKIMMLQYRIKRYQAMGNGAMCQTLNGTSKTADEAACHVIKHTNIYHEKSGATDWFSALSFLFSSYFFFKVTSLISTTPPLFCPRIAT